SDPTGSPLGRRQASMRVSRGQEPGRDENDDAAAGRGARALSRWGQILHRRITAPVRECKI
ncbi:MAG TPA: hypothetical protein VD769_09685, partial [Gaiellaceae bacterium]|nr:hypothetical protein [Gaiellaceae bacterium]